MRYLIEDKDSVSAYESKLCYSKVACIKHIGNLFQDWQKAAGDTANTEEFNGIAEEFSTIQTHVIRGMLGAGDSVQIEWDGMTFNLSILASRGKHS